MKKEQRVAIICNGNLKSISFHKKILKSCGVVICADGGANNAANIGVVPDYLVGDMDSIDKKILAKLKTNRITTVILKQGQDETDTELALELALKHRPSEIIFLCAIGDRLDHSIANIMLLDRVPHGVNAQIIDENNEIHLLTSVRRKIGIAGKKGDIVSTIALSAVDGLTYSGLKWGVKNKNTQFGWLGVCNEMNSDTATVQIKTGKLLLIKAREHA